MSEWVRTRLDSVAQVRSSRRVLKSQWRRSGIPFYRGREVTRLSQQGETTPELFIEEELYKALKEGSGVPERGDLLVTAIGTIGNCFIVQDGQPFYFKDASVLWLSPGPDADSTFLKYWISSSAFRAQLDRGNGATVDTLTIEALRSMTVLLPPLDEQKRIVAKLDEVSLLGDRLELNLSSQLAKSKELRARLLAEVFAEPAPWVPLGELVEVLDSRRVPITKKDRVSGDVPYYGATGVQDFVADFLFDEDLVLLGEDGAKWSAGDRSAFLISGKTWVNNHAHVLRPDRSKVLDAWLAEWLCVADLVPYTSGATVQKLNQARMKEILVPLPPVARQRDLTTRIARIHAGIQKLDANATATLAEIALLRKASLSSLLSGAS